MLSANTALGDCISVRSLVTNAFIDVVKLYFFFVARKYQWINMANIYDHKQKLYVSLNYEYITWQSVVCLLPIGLPGNLQSSLHEFHQLGSLRCPCTCRATANQSEWIRPARFHGPWNMRSNLHACSNNEQIYYLLWNAMRFVVIRYFQFGCNRHQYEVTDVAMAYRRCLFHFSIGVECFYAVLHIIVDTAMRWKKT